MHTDYIYLYWCSCKNQLEKIPPIYFFAQNSHMTTKFGNDDKVIQQRQSPSFVLYYCMYVCTDSVYDATFLLSGSQFFVLNCEPETKNVAS
jgi:hypothetical protein